MIEPATQVTHADIHAMEPRSRANGPGVRFVVWFQGCTLGCAGCFNPATHSGSLGASRRSLAELYAEIDLAMIGAPIEGLTLSGGEPMQQIQAATALLAYARQHQLSTLVFSGYTKQEISALPGGNHALAQVDVLIDGRYRSDLRLGEGLRGSSNQRVHLLSPRYSQADIDCAPLGEVRIASNGEVVLTGVVPLRLKR
jgi:anaerobic ribonucleoside-triphosphate reductase activating protein